MQLRKNLPKGFHEKWSRIFFIVAMIGLFIAGIAGGIYQCNREVERSENLRCVAVKCTGCYGACESPDTIIVRTAPNESSVGWSCYDWDQGDCDGWVPEGFMRYDAGYRSEDDYEECHCIEWEHIDYEGDEDGDSKNDSES